MTVDRWSLVYSTCPDVWAPPEADNLAIRFRNGDNGLYSLTIPVTHQLHGNTLSDAYGYYQFTLGEIDPGYSIAFPDAEIRVFSWFPKANLAQVIGITNEDKSTSVIGSYDPSR